MGKIRVCVVGYGNVGKEAVECVKQASDMHLVGVVEVCDVKAPGVPLVRDLGELGEEVDVAILTIPSRLVPSVAPSYLEKGINTVDGYDIHGDCMLSLKNELGACAKSSGTVSVIGAGWDPGSDSVIRILFQAIAPHGVTYTNFGPGMSMGHSVAARGIPGVKDAVSFTLPAGYGQHFRDVFVEIDDEQDFEQVAAEIKKDSYFANDVTRVEIVDDVDKVKVMAHGVHLQRIGSSGTGHNQLLELRMKISNPSATAQVMVSAARASMTLDPGCYVLAEVPPISLLPGNRDEIIKTLV
ncbi:MAG TPA: diaminopimelate dehydrogenase [Bacillota bacterium]|nr:diaminopimelate dehydrogenase [Candidatus Fermentithermobacillaceae bacterium]HOB29972.1 diaminopimelate dehydrogenase [Bacillota bacterium]HOK63843.1 diaminopimelate dehydrogenase [Bacillota bacterium]HOL11469.1 diaminopimelate dehydrogenase [Bacillota bacterium]HPP60390.1 diaminopimelate dehydrogenase [Bacillota bacterium]